MNSFFQFHFKVLRNTALTLVLLCSCYLYAQPPGGQSAGGGGDDVPLQVAKENPCVRLLEKTRSPEKHHTQQAHRPLVVIGEQGTELLFPADAFVYPDGTPVTGDVEILLTEVNDKPDLILNNLPTMSNGRVLVSGGVVKIEAIADGKQLRLAPGKSVLVNFQEGYVEGMQLFKGQYNSTGEMNWVPMSDAPIERNRKVPAIDVGDAAAMPLFLDYGKVNPNTMRFADGQHAVVGYMVAMMRTGYTCVGSDNIYIEMNTDETGRVVTAKTLTGRNPCYRLALEEVAMTLQFDLKQAKGKERQFFVELAFNEPITGKEGENMFASLAGNADAFNNPQVYAAVREYMEEEKAKNFAQNAMRLTSLGWINCDRFLEGGQRVNVSASVQNPELVGKTKAFLVFNDMRSVIEGECDNKGNVNFQNIPTGLKAKVVVIGYLEHTGAYLQSADVTTKAGNVASLALKKVSEEKLREAVAGL